MKTTKKEQIQAQITKLLDEIEALKGGTPTEELLQESIAYQEELYGVMEDVRVLLQQGNPGLSGVSIALLHLNEHMIESLLSDGETLDRSIKVIELYSKDTV